MQKFATYLFAWLLELYLLMRLNIFVENLSNLPSLFTQWCPDFSGWLFWEPMNQGRNLGIVKFGSAKSGNKFETVYLKIWECEGSKFKVRTVCSEISVPWNIAILNFSINLCLRKFGTPKIRTSTGRNALPAQVHVDLFQTISVPRIHWGHFWNVRSSKDLLYGAELIKQNLRYCTDELPVSHSNWSHT